MMKRRLAVVGFVIGIVLVLGSLIWPAMLPDQAIWSAQEAGRMTQKAVQIHNQMLPNAEHRRKNGRLHKDGEAENPHRHSEKLMQEHAQLRAKLDQALFLRYQLPFYLRTIGVIVVLGAGVFLLTKD